MFLVLSFLAPRSAPFVPPPCRSKFRASLGLLVFSSAAWMGCARAVSTTAVHADGSWTRTVAFHGSSPDQKSMSVGTEIKDAFILPQGPAWKIKNEKTDAEVTVTAVREMFLGGTIENDIVTKSSDKNSPAINVMTNRVSVKQIAPGRYEYRETLHWLGKMPKELVVPDGDAMRLLKAWLPPQLATTVNVQQLARALTRAIWRVMFGPGDPLVAHFSELMMQPDLIKHRIGGQMATALKSALDELPGQKLTPQQKQDLFKKMTDYAVQSGTTKAQAAQNGGPEKPAPGGSFASLTFDVKLPGRVIETSGEVDPLTGEVYWAVYPEAAVLGDVTMRAVCDTNPQAAAR